MAIAYYFEGALSALYAPFYLAPLHLLAPPRDRVAGDACRASGKVDEGNAAFDGVDALADRCIVARKRGVVDQAVGEGKKDRPAVWQGRAFVECYARREG